MPRRPATVTQADIVRTIRAVQAAGLPVLRVVVRGDGVAVETTTDEIEQVPEIKKLADEGRVVVL